MTALPLRAHLLGPTHHPQARTHRHCHRGMLMLGPLAGEVVSLQQLRKQRVVRRWAMTMTQSAPGAAGRKRTRKQQRSPGRKRKRKRKKKPILRPKRKSIFRSPTRRWQLRREERRRDRRLQRNICSLLPLRPVAPTTAPAAIATRRRGRPLPRPPPQGKTRGRSRTKPVLLPPLLLPLPTPLSLPRPLPLPLSRRRRGPLLALRFGNRPSRVRLHARPTGEEQNRQSKVGAPR